MKPWWQSKTLWVNALTLLVGALTTLADSELLKPEQVAMLTGMAIPVVNIILRWVTTKPITLITKAGR